MGTYKSAVATAWVVVMETSLQEEAYLVQGFLENNGIPCVIEDLKFHEMPVNFGPMSKLRLLVPKERLQEGKDLIAERDNSAEGQVLRAED